MTVYFFDSSALVKRYIPESGSAWVRALTDTRFGHNILIAHLSQVEIISAAMRRAREGSISTRTARGVRLLVDRHASRQYYVIGLTGVIASLAADLLETHPLRAFDSIQLASALESNRRMVNAVLAPLTFVASDNRLLSAASAEGLNVENPDNHP